MTAEKKFFSAANLTKFAVLLALVIVLQVFGGFVSGFLPVELSFVLIPIVLGAVILGPVAGGTLGLAFGVVTIVYGAAGISSFTAILLADHPLLTVLVCLVKGFMAGFVPGLLFRLLSGKNTQVAVFAAAAAAPVMNTGFFILGMLLMTDTLAANFVSSGAMSDIVYFLFIGCAGVNFIIEFAINLILAPAIHTVYRVVEKRIAGKKQEIIHDHLHRYR